MPPRNDRSPARLLAPIALTLFAMAFLAVLATSGTGDGEGGGADRGARTTTETTTETTAATRPRSRASAIYTVKTGDTLGEIAQKTRVEVTRLQELNPELDPQALVSGQKIKLRE